MPWFQDHRIKRWVIVVAFLLKVIAGIVAGEIYKAKYEGGDTYNYFKSSQIISESFKNNPSDFWGIVTGAMEYSYFIDKYRTLPGWNNMDVVYNDNRTVIRINAIIGLISEGYYNVHVVFFSFLAFTGLFALFKTFKLVTTLPELITFLGVFMIPGVIFWTSGLNKESILMFTMGVFFSNYVKILYKGATSWNFFFLVISGLLFVHIKAYVLVMLTPALIAFAWVAGTNEKYSLFKYTFIYLITGIIFFNFNYILEDFDPVQILYMKRVNFEAFADYAPEDFKSYIELPQFEASWWSILQAFPKAIYTVFTRPYLWESDSLIVSLAALENITLILIFIAGIVMISWNDLYSNRNLFLFCLFFIITYYALIGLTTPVMGAIVRYKAPLLPFFIMIPIIMSGGKISRNRKTPKRTPETIED
jgi:hypothetical protein